MTLNYYPQERERSDVGELHGLRLAGGGIDPVDGVAPTQSTKTV